MGVNVDRTTTYTFALSGMMAGAAGVLLGSLFFASFNMGFMTGIKALSPRRWAASAASRAP